MSPTAGALRLFVWSRRPGAKPTDEAHAFDDRQGFVHRSVCTLEPWKITRERVESGPLCSVCRQIVEAAAARALADVVALEPQMRLEGIEQYQAEGR